MIILITRKMEQLIATKDAIMNQALDSAAPFFCKKLTIISGQEEPNRVPITLKKLVILLSLVLSS